jgi:hypothetical protein
MAFALGCQPLSPQPPPVQLVGFTVVDGGVVADLSNVGGLSQWSCGSNRLLRADGGELADEIPRCSTGRPVLLDGVYRENSFPHCITCNRISCTPLPKTIRVEARERVETGRQTLDGGVEVTVVESTPVLAPWILRAEVFANPECRFDAWELDFPISP